MAHACASFILRRTSGWAFLALLFAASLARCTNGPAEEVREEAAIQDAAAETNEPPPTETTGFAASLQLIERKLGPLHPVVREHLVVVEVRHWGFADSACTAVDRRRIRTGALIVHRCIADDVRALFAGLLRDSFPIAKVIPIHRYGLNADTTGWDDAASMADNNTSAFNYRRKAANGEPSKHALGLAIDINPLLNPLERDTKEGLLREPAAGRYDPQRPGTLTRELVRRHLGSRGWSWGGLWPRPKDHQHIEKFGRSCAHLYEPSP